MSLIRLMVSLSLLRALRRSQNLFYSRQTLLHLVESILPQRDQSALAARAPERRHVLVLRHHVAQRVAHDEQLVNSQPPGIAGLPATITALAFENVFGRKALGRKKLAHV